MIAFRVIRGPPGADTPEQTHSHHARVRDQHMSSQPSDDKRRQAPLISRSSILILGGVLIGFTCSEGFGSGLSSAKFLTCVAAMFGLVAFIALDLVGYQRRMRSERLLHQKAIEKMEQRVERHLMEESRVARRHAHRQVSRREAATFV